MENSIPIFNLDYAVQSPRHSTEMEEVEIEVCKLLSSSYIIFIDYHFFYRFCQRAVPMDLMKRMSLFLMILLKASMG